MGYLKVLRGVVLSIVVFLSVGCEMLDHKPPGKGDVKIDLGNGLILKNEGGKILLIEDGVVLKPCGKKCDVFNGSVSVHSIESKSYNLGLKVPVEVVDIFYSPLGRRDALTFAALDGLHPLTQTDAYQDNIILSHTVSDECSTNQSEARPVHNGCCSQVVTSVTGLGLIHRDNKRDEDCRRPHRD